MTIIIRSFLIKDRAAVLRSTKRLSEFDMPEWRRAEKIDQTNEVMVQNTIEESEPENEIYVAEDESSTNVVGYVRLQIQSDYFSGEKHGYVANIAVDQSFEGQGIGQMLLEFAESWTQEKGYDLIKLHVFAENKHARKVYEKFGYQPSIIQYVKVIGVP